MQRLTSLVLVLTFGGAVPTDAQKNGCKDIPIQWTFSPVATMPDGTQVPSTINSDGKAYSSSTGTSNTVIHVCGTDPTYDATMLVGGKRKVGFFFGAPLTGSVLQEVVAAGTYSDAPFMNVRNILCVGCADKTLPFTTRMGIQLKLNSQDYRFRFMPTATGAEDRHTDPAAIPAENTPYEGSPVLVIPQSYDCHVGGTTRPAWIVRGTNASVDDRIAAGENLQIGTLRRVTRTGTVHAGQYSMPFEIRIEALSCFGY